MLVPLAANGSRSLMSATTEARIQAAIAPVWKGALQEDGMKRAALLAGRSSDLRGLRTMEARARL